MQSLGSEYYKAKGFTPSDDCVGKVVTLAASGLAAGECALCTASTEPCGVITGWDTDNTVTVAIEGEEAFVRLGSAVPASYPAGRLVGSDANGCGAPVTPSLSGTAFSFVVGTLHLAETNGVAVADGLYPIRVSVRVVPVAAA